MKSYSSKAKRDEKTARELWVSEPAQLAHEGLRGVRSSVRLAEEMGARLGKCQVLLRRLPLRRREPLVKTILIADDEPKIQTLIRMFLEPESYEILTANNGVEALEALRKNRIDLLILDVMMPKMDGFEVLEKLQADPSIFPEPRILLLAASRNDGTQQPNAGVVIAGEIPFLIKGGFGVGDPKTLRRVVRKILANDPVDNFSVTGYR